MSALNEQHWFLVFQMGAYAAKLKELETLYFSTDGGLTPVNSAEMEAALREAGKLVDDLQDNTEQLRGTTAAHLHHR